MMSSLTAQFATDPSNIQVEYKAPHADDVYIYVKGVPIRIATGELIEAVDITY